MPNQRSPHVDAVHLTKQLSRKNFDEISTQLPKIKGNPRAPDVKGTLTDLFNETSQMSSQRVNHSKDASTIARTSLTHSRYNEPY